MWPIVLSWDSYKDLIFFRRELQKLHRKKKPIYLNMACFMENAPYREYNLFHSQISGLYNIYCAWKTLPSVCISSNPCFFLTGEVNSDIQYYFWILL